MASNEEIKILITAEDKASAALNKVAKSGISLESAFKGMSVVGVAGLGALGAAAFKAVGDFQAVEVANKKLENAVINVSKGTRQQVDDIKALTAELQKKGVVDADSLNVGVAQLSTFGLTTEMVKRLTPALADLTVNQAGVNATTQDFEASANTMAKALNGQFGILEKSGIRFTEAQQKLIQFGTEQQRTSALIEGFNQNLKFTNETALQTFEGRMVNLKNRLGDVSETVGESLIPVIEKLLNAVLPVVEKVAVWIEQNPKLTLTIAAVTAGVLALVTIVGVLGLAMPGIIAGFVTLGVILTGPGGIVLAMIAVIAVINQAVKAWQALKIEQEALNQTAAAGIELQTKLADAIDKATDPARKAKLQTLAQDLERANKAAQSAANAGFFKNLGVGLGVTSFKAAGGPVSAGKGYVVGEKGPEFFMPSSSGTIVPNSKMPSGVSGMVINITGTFLSEDAAIRMADLVTDRLKLELKV